MQIAIQYIRFSTLEQQKGGSLERQRNCLSRYIEYEGLARGDEYFDRGRSAFKGAHREESGELARLEREVAEGIHRGSVLLVERLDRLSRLEVFETTDLIRHFLRNGVDVCAVESRCYFRAGEKIEAHQIYPLIADADAAHRFSADLQDRTLKGKAIARKAKREKGEALTARVPAWLRMDAARKIHVIEERAAVVRRIFALADMGQGARSIARDLQMDEVPTFGRARIWQHSYIGKILRNRAVLGEFAPATQGEEEEIWPDYYPKVIDHDLFGRVIASAQARKTSGVSVKRGRVPNLFGGVLRCQACGGSMVYSLKRSAGTEKHDRRRATVTVLRRDEGMITCRDARASGGKLCANTDGWGYLRLEDRLIEALLPLAMDARTFENRGEVSRVSLLLAERRRELEIEDTKRGRLWEAFANSGSDGAYSAAREVDAAIMAIRDNIAGLERQLNEAAGRMSSAAHLVRLENIAVQLYSDDLTTRVPVRRKVATAMAQIIERIEFSADSAVVHFRGTVGYLTIERGGKVTSFDLLKDTSGGDISRRRAALLKEGIAPFKAWRNR